MTEIEKLIKESLRDVKQLYKTGQTNSKILFPNYSNQKTVRYSEQELKCIFINKIESTDYYYSVETPSREKYRFKDKKKPRVLLKVDSSEKFQSSMIDVSLYNQEMKLISHIEFKHKTCELFKIQKDFLKLIFEFQGNDRNYFVHYLDKSDEKTKYVVFNKYKEALNEIQKNNDTSVITKNLQNVFVFVIFAGLETGENFFYFSLDTLKNSDITHLKGERLD